MLLFSGSSFVPVFKLKCVMAGGAKTSKDRLQERLYEVQRRVRATGGGVVEEKGEYF